MTKNKSSKITVGVVFGGRSAEHQVSLVSAASVIDALDKNKYRVIPVGITPDGKWLSSSDTVKLLRSGKHLDIQPEKILTPDPSHKGLVSIDRPHHTDERLDVIFPVLHGSFGEDGTVQGLFELAGIPYVGAGVLGSSVGMDKVITKQLCERDGIPVTPYFWFLKNDYRKQSATIIANIEKKLR
ncbi:MAG TPA: D-alanine--D-alanine ligase A, partial [Bacteroidota bacterium]|nr:D-alanine--D-alanine ligase A [Bacteroidota bacterium]